MRVVALAAAAVLVATACAGSVGKYRNLSVEAASVTAEEQGAEATEGLGALDQAAGTDVAGAKVSAGQAARERATVGGGPSASEGSTSAPRAASPGGRGSTVGVTKESVTIGFFYPKTGHYAGLARDAEPAMRAAFAEAGVIHGRKLELATYDDGSQNASTIQTNERRAKDESFLYTSVVSESNVVLAPLANQHRVPAILGNMDRQTALPLTYAFALPTYWATQARMLPTFIRNELKAANKRMGIVYEGTSAAKGAKDAFKAKAKSEGMNVVFEQPIAVNQSTCANEVSNFQANRVELVYMMTGPLGAICMLRDARAVGYRPIWTGVGLSWSFNVVAAASGGTADGIRTINSFTTLDTPAGKRFTAAMRKYEPDARYGAEDDITMLAFGLGVTIAEAIRRNGPDLTRESFVATMETKMKGFNSGYYPPVNYAPGDRSGGDKVAFSRCCTDNKWTTPNAVWRRL